jgi:hypothetical protein
MTAPITKQIVYITVETLLPANAGDIHETGIVPLLCSLTADLLLKLGRRVGPDILDRITSTGGRGNNITVHDEPRRRNEKADRHI